jgi:hypothetical protein
MGGAGVDRPPSLICPRRSDWRAALLPSLRGERPALMCSVSRSRRGEQGPGKIGVILALALPALAAEPPRSLDVDKFCEEFLHKISNEARQEAADLIANSAGKPESSGFLMNATQIFEGKNFDFTKKVVDKGYNGASRQIVYYSYIEDL